MKEFRIAKCLDNDGKIREFAIFKDGSRRKSILTDENGKFFYVDNELNFDENDKVLKRSFTGRIKDAIDTIMSCNGDCIKVRRLFGEHIYVLYYIDRSVGEELKNKTIEGWKNTRFTYAIECGNKNSFNGYSKINTKGEQIGYFNSEYPVMNFDTKEQAKQYIDRILERAAYYAERLANGISHFELEEERSKYFDQIIDKVKIEAETPNNILKDFVFDMLTDNLELKNTYGSLDKWGYRIIQDVRREVFKDE